MALTGLNNPEVVFNTTSSTNSGTINISTNLCVIMAVIWTGNGNENPAGWTATLNSVTITPAGSNHSAATDFASVFYVVEDHAPGAFTFTITGAGGSRAGICAAFHISGESATPIITQGFIDWSNQNVATFDLATTLPNAGDGLVTLAGLRGGGYAASMTETGDGDFCTGSPSQTGNNGFNDISWAALYTVAATDSDSQTLTVNWTGSTRLYAPWVQIQAGAAGGASVDVTAASLALTQHNTGLTAQRALDAVKAAITLTAYPVTFSRVYALNATTAHLALTQHDVDAATLGNLNVAKRRLQLTQHDTGLLVQRGLTVTNADLTLTGHDVTFTRSKTVIADNASLTLTAYDVELQRQLNVNVSKAALTLTAYDVALEYGVVQALALDEMPFDGYVFASFNHLAANVTITGVGSTGDQIQVRGASVGGNTSWSSTTVDILGEWSVTFAVPRAEWANWYTPEARIGTNDLTKITGTNKFGCGYKIIIFGQSELEYILAIASAFSQLPYPTLLAENATVHDWPNLGALHTTRITTAGSNIINVGLTAVLNALHYIVPGVKFEIGDAAESGTSRAQLMADANTTRNWTDFQPLIDKMRSGGSDINALVECWYNSDAATLDNMGLEWSPFYMGQRWGGGAFTVGTANPDSVRNTGALVDHILWDIEAPSDSLGRGVFIRDVTKLHILTPMPFHDTETTEQRNFNHNGSGGLIANRINQLDRPARDQILAFAADSRVQTFLGSAGPSAHVVDFNGGIHPLPDDQWGVPQFALNFLATILRIANVNAGEPTIIGTEAPADGSYADIIVDLPNDGNLTTIRKLNSIADPGTEPPHYQEVNGVEIRRLGDADSARRPVMKLTETSYPANYRGTVTITDQGTGVAPNRRGRVRITPENAFVTGDMLEYLRGEACGHILEPRDVTARLFLDQLIGHVPSWYDATQLYPFQGVNVKPQPPVLSITLDTLTNAVTVDAATASLTLTAYSVGMVVTRVLNATAGSLVLGDNAAAFAHGYTQPVTPTSLSLTAYAVGMAVTRVLNAQTANLALTSGSIVFGANGQLAVVTKHLALAEYGVGLNAIHKLDSATENLSLNAYPVGLTVQRKIIVDTASLNIAGKDAALPRLLQLSVQKAALSLSGYDALFDKQPAITANPASLIMTAHPVALIYSAASQGRSAFPDDSRTWVTLVQPGSWVSYE